MTDHGFGIYVHWPFCAAKCPYCDFNSHVVQNVDQSEWASALSQELRTLSEWQDKRQVTSIFFGGGTPSLMEGRTVSRVLEAINTLLDVSSDAEITLEANPTSAEAERFQDYRAAGVNRLSLGVQALNPEALKNLGRLHTVDEALAAFGWARETFPWLSFDMIYARPGQSLSDWSEELKHALHFAADHLSLYQLTIEPGTPFYELEKAGRLTLPPEDVARDLYELTGELCATKQLVAYEVSNYAIPGAEGRHNLTYWRYGDYIGVGPGAHGRLTLKGKKMSTTTEAIPAKWLAAVKEHGHGVKDKSIVPAGEQFEEYLLMGLRLAEGVEKSRAEKLLRRTIDWSPLGDLMNEGLLSQTNTRLAATSEGRLVLNQLISETLRALVDA